MGYKFKPDNQLKILGVDASNIRGGGGLTHLIELLRAAHPMTSGFSQVIVWSGKSTLDKIKNQSWLIKSHQPLLDKSLLHRSFWQRFKLSSLARKSNCDLLFIPGGSFEGSFSPIVVFHQNLIPFEWSEIKRFGWSWTTLKFILLYITQSRSFKKANGVIFLSQYARNIVIKKIHHDPFHTIIPHGIDNRFTYPPRPQLPINHYSINNPFRILYISQINMYKHQWNVVKAIVQLKKLGLPVVLDIVGAAYSPALILLQKTLKAIDPTEQTIKYRGSIPYEELHKQYNHADLFVFASSCETFGQILTEAMSAGLPIACSNRSAMPELLKDAGIYFDPEDPQDIAQAIQTMIESPELRTEKAKAAFSLAQKYSWQRCASETFDFFKNTTNNFIKNKNIA